MKIHHHKAWELYITPSGREWYIFEDDPLWLQDLLKINQFMREAVYAFSVDFET
jgi:hypothetical protein